MDYSALKVLIQTHPQWPSVDDETLATWCNEKVVSRDKTSLPATTILQAILTYKSEWDAVSDANKATVRDVLYIASGEGVPTAAGNPIRNILVSVLGTQTKQALAIAIGELVSRASAAGIYESVRVGDVMEAKRVG